jgi:hypothetical protein
LKEISFFVEKEDGTTLSLFTPRICSRKNRIEKPIEEGFSKDKKLSFSFFSFSKEKKEKDKTFCIFLNRLSSS